MPIKPFTYAIGDIHGCLTELEMLIQAISPKPEDTIIFLGDYIDRGPKSKEVINKIMGFDSCNTVVLDILPHQT